MAEAPASPPAAYRVVWHVPEGGDVLVDRVLRNIMNLLEDLSPDDVEVEVVAHGAGLPLVLAATPGGDRVADLQRQGVVFLACQNTMTNRGLTTADLLPGVGVVASGVGELVRRQGQGWSYVRG